MCDYAPLGSQSVNRQRRWFKILMSLQSGKKILYPQKVVIVLMCGYLSEQPEPWLLKVTMSDPCVHIRTLTTLGGQSFHSVGGKWRDVSVYKWYVQSEAIHVFIVSGLCGGRGGRNNGFRLTSPYSKEAIMASNRLFMDLRSITLC
ncbi:hypothetical protein J6590_020133 [Homalodisca vitripennis]|nr:hypothetical protein J6590_020133 [Homalodisca vitripennis]